MCSLGVRDLDVRIAADGTRLIDRRFRSSSSPGYVGKGETLDQRFLESRMPFDVAVPLEDEPETQVINLSEETQLIDFGSDTQAIDCQDCMETQLVDQLEDCIENIETQLIDQREDCIENVETQLIDQHEDCIENFETQLVDQHEDCIENFETQLVDQHEDCIENVTTQLVGRHEDCIENVDTPLADQYGDCIENVETQLLDQCEYRIENRNPQLVDQHEICIKNVGTQLVDQHDTQVAINSDDEDTCGTDVLGSSEKVSEDDSLRKDGDSMDEKKRLRTSFSNDTENGEQPNSLPDEPCSSGSAGRGFTSIRAASLRASGLAAHRMYINRANSRSCSVISKMQTSEEYASENNLTSCIGACPIVGEKVDHEFDAHNNVEDFNHGKKHRVGCSAVRKLFAEDTEFVRTGTTPDETADFVALHLVDEEHAGLSYVESQEPGDLSQANALDFVDKFLKDNVEELRRELDFRKTSGRKSSSNSVAKGPQNLAKSVSRITVRTGVFDWDNSHEDEGGGDIFCRRKDEFFDVGRGMHRSMMSARKFKNRQQNAHGTTIKPSSAPNKRTGLVDSDSRAEVGIKRRRTVKTAEMSHKRDLTKEFGAQSNRVSSVEHLEITAANADVPDIFSVGFDTQLAAEAMEELCQSKGLAKDDHCDISVPTRNKAGNNEEPSVKSSILLQKHSMNAKRLHSPEQLVRKSKRTVRDTNRKQKSDEMPSEFLQDKNVESLGRGQIGEFVGWRGARTSNSTTLTIKQHLPGEVGFFTPIARRTRSFVAANQQQSKEGTVNNCKRDISSAANIGHCKRKRTARAGRSSKTSAAESKMVKDGDRPQVVLALRSNGQSVVELKSKSLGAVSAAHLNVHLQMQNCEAQSDHNVCDDSNVDMNGQLAIENLHLPEVIVDSKEKGDVDETLSMENAEANVKFNNTPTEKLEGSAACITPVNCLTPSNDVSPICIGNGYLNQSCRKNLSRSFLVNEVKRLNASRSEPLPACKDMRKRRDISDVRVLYSKHLDKDIVKQQKKILSRLGASAVSSIADATHFVTDEFVRTSNMLEAIASGKPVVTHLWVESCGQASCFLDERNYILRDAKKEKQFGFSLPVSLARACQHPLLQGRRVFITPNTKPGKEIISSLVKRVHGQLVERINRSALRDYKVPEDLLILSCEEDYDLCLPFLEKGAAVYSSELLLNGIVIQKLEFERHHLFPDHIKTTRSTTWLKKDGNKFVPVAKHK